MEELALHIFLRVKISHKKNHSPFRDRDPVKGNYIITLLFCAFYVNRKVNRKKS